MGLAQTVKEYETLKKGASKKAESILSFLQSTYEKHQNEIDRKAVDYWEKFTGRPIDRLAKHHFGMGCAIFEFSSNPELKVCLRYQNETWSRIEDCPQPGSEYLKNIKEELEAFAKDIGTRVLAVHDPFSNNIEIKLD